MFEIQMASKKKSTDPNGPILVMDFEGPTAVDLVNRSRVFSTVNRVTISSAYSKNGSSSLEVPGDAVLSTPVSTDLIFTGDFWFEMWALCKGANPIGTSSGLNMLFGYGSYPNAPGLLRFGIEGVKPTIRTPSGSADTPLITSANSIAYDSWYNYGLGRKNNLVYLFLDGVLQGTAPYSGVFGFGSRFSIGAYEDSRLSGGTYAGWNGYIDRLRIYDKCLHTEAYVPESSLY